MNSVDHFTLNGVYYVENKVEGINPLAIRPDIHPTFIGWEDTGHGRIIRYAVLFFDGQEVTLPTVAPATLPNKIDVIRQQGEDIRLVKLTKKIFDEKLKDIVAKGKSLDFSSDEAVQHHFMTTDFGG